MPYSVDFLLFTWFMPALYIYIGLNMQTLDSFVITSSVAGGGGEHYEMQIVWAFEQVMTDEEHRYRAGLHCIIVVEEKTATILNTILKIRI